MHSKQNSVPGLCVSHNVKLRNHFNCLLNNIKIDISFQKCLGSGLCSCRTPSLLEKSPSQDLYLQAEEFWSHKDTYGFCQLQNLIKAIDKFDTSDGNGADTDKINMIRWIKYSAWFAKCGLRPDFKSILQDKDVSTASKVPIRHIENADVKITLFGDTIGRLIGKNGRYLKSIADECGALSVVADMKSMDPYTPKPSTGYALVFKISWKPSIDDSDAKQAVTQKLSQRAKKVFQAYERHRAAVLEYYKRRQERRAARRAAQAKKPSEATGTYLQGTVINFKQMAIDQYSRTCKSDSISRQDRRKKKQPFMKKSCRKRLPIENEKRVKTSKEAKAECRDPFSYLRRN
eukprot:Colp12_sorted_trinity150504_noHs@1615